MRALAQCDKSNKVAAPAIREEGAILLATLCRFAPAEVLLHSESHSSGAPSKAGAMVMNESAANTRYFFIPVPCYNPN